MEDERGISTDQAYVESHETNFLTPIQQVMTNARESVFRVAEHFEAIGVTRDLIEVAAEHAADSAKAEFEAKANEDPIRRVVEILQSSVSSGRDQEIVDKKVEKLEQQRRSWKELVEVRRTQARLQGTLEFFNVGKVIKDVIPNGHAPTFTEYNLGNPQVYFEILGSELSENRETQQVEGEKELIKPSEECMNNILIGLGVLQKGENYSVLRGLPSGKYVPKSSPSYNPQNEKAENLRTNIPDVMVTSYLRDCRVLMRVPVSVFEKIINFPTSV